MPNKQTGLFYGWRMVAASSALRVLGAGLHSFGFTVFFLPLSQDLNLNRTSTSLAFSLARAEGAIEGPIIGHLLDRYGPKPIMLAAVLLMGTGYLLLSQVNSYATFLIVYLGVISLAHAGGFMHAPMVLINTWFIRYRARAITISSAAFGLGGVLVAPVLSVVVQAWGWRWGAAIGGILFLAIGLPLSLTIRRSPESMDLLPDGAEPARETAKDRAEQTIKSNVDVTVAEALRSFAFWGSVLAAGIRNGSYHAISVHFVPLMVWKGLSEGVAASLLGAFASINLVAHFVLGWIADRVNKPKLLAACHLLPALSLPPLLSDSGYWQLWLFTITFTFLDASFPIIWATVGDFFGRRNFAMIRGMMSFFYMWGSFAGPIMAGAIYDHTESYRLVLWIMLSLLTFATLLVLFLIRPWTKRMRAMTSA